MQLVLDRVNKSFGDHHVLRDVSITLNDCHSLGILGPSGGGKTTLLRVIAGLIRPENGTVQVNGRVVPSDESRLREYRRCVGMVFQAYNLFPHMSALRNITLPLEKVHRMDPRSAREIAESLLKRFQLTPHMHKMPGQLSGGQKQRIALSRAIAIGPEFLLLDEPTSALDPELTAEVLDMIEELRREDIHLVLVTHNMGFARHVTDYVLFMDDGRILEHGPPSRVFERPESHKVTAFFDRVLKY